ncbi:response regulator transcription factor [Pontibacter beigongshangensis]|uniref:response regulator transcription factor n=1 Tax=Pontibacter beigongshangensis TaxID=2574733 RepID=UPI0016507E7D|nr:LuxR C-terminal-related transcriptional regulator [Pontibacter beigongshangensis]
MQKVNLMLSKREQEILRLIAKGYSSKMMSEELQITQLTVQTHRRNMLRKMNMNNSMELISWAFRAGVLASK